MKSVPVPVVTIKRERDEAGPSTAGPSTIKLPARKSARVSDKSADKTHAAVVIKDEDTADEDA